MFLNGCKLFDVHLSVYIIIWQKAYFVLVHYNEDQKRRNLFVMFLFFGIVCLFVSFLILKSNQLLSSPHL